MAKYTRIAIMNTFMDLLEHESLDKITVKDIIEIAEINRNTFYYYFNDIYDLLDQIFEEELNKVLSTVNEDCTFYEEYVRTGSILINHKKAIIHIYQSKSKEIVEGYLQKTTEEVVRRFVKRAARQYEISEEGIQFITCFYSSALVGNAMHWIKEGMPAYRKDFMKMVSTSYEATIDDMIRNYVKCEQI